jgi:hypothetical protein
VHSKNMAASPAPTAFESTANSASASSPERRSSRGVQSWCRGGAVTRVFFELVGWANRSQKCSQRLIALLGRWQIDVLGEALLSARLVVDAQVIFQPLLGFGWRCFGVSRDLADAL